MTEFSNAILQAKVSLNPNPLIEENAISWELPAVEFDDQTFRITLQGDMVFWANYADYGRRQWRLDPVFQLDDPSQMQALLEGRTVNRQLQARAVDAPDKVQCTPYIAVRLVV